MPRKGHVAKRDVLADPMYNSKLVTKLINNIMLDGKRGTHTSSLITVGLGTASCGMKWAYPNIN